MDVRRSIAKILTDEGHRVILMEDEPDHEDEDMIQKFDRLLRNKVTDVLIFWPPLAKMQTTYDELVLLYDRKVFLRRSGIAIWVLHHVSVAQISGDEFKVLEVGNRSRYLTAIVRLGVSVLEWETESELKARVQQLSTELSM
jgi:hypothetical protein